MVESFLEGQNAVGKGETSISKELHCRPINTGLFGKRFTIIKKQEFGNKGPFQLQNISRG